MDDADDKKIRKFDSAMEVDYEEEEVSPKKIAKKVVDNTNDNVILENANSVDKVVDKDPKNQHEDDTVKGQEDNKLEDLLLHNRYYHLGLLP
jgi:hypothetical protein